MTTRWGASVRTLRSHAISMFRSKSARLYWGHALAARGVLLRHAKDRMLVGKDHRSAMTLKHRAKASK